MRRLEVGKWYVTDGGWNCIAIRDLGSHYFDVWHEGDGYIHRHYDTYYPEDIVDDGSSPHKTPNHRIRYELYEKSFTGLAAISKLLATVNIKLHLELVSTSPMSYRAVMHDDRDSSSFIEVYSPSLAELVGRLSYLIDLKEGMDCIKKVTNK